MLIELPIFFIELSGRILKYIILQFASFPRSTNFETSYFTY